MKNYVGRKCKGFMFEDGTDGVKWLEEKKNQIGEVGLIVKQIDGYVVIEFKDYSWSYPISLIEPHLIPENYIRNSIFVGLDAGRDVTEGDNIVIIGDNITSLDKSQKDVLFLNDKVLIGRTIQGVPFNLFDVLMQNVFGEFGENVSYGASSVRDTTTGCSSIAIGIPTKVDEGSKLDIQGTNKSPEIPQLGEGIEMENLEKMLDWLVELNIQHYKTEKQPDYIPSGNSHFYLKRSQERFTSMEMIKIFHNQADNELMERWNYAIADTMRGK